jgi:hypothetical protein
MAKSTYNPIGKIGVTATEDIAEKLFVTAAGKVAGADENAVGISEYFMPNGDTYGVITLGTALLTLGGTVAVGDHIKSDANGKGVKATLTSGALVDGVNALALEAGVSGDVIEVLIVH